MKKLLSLIMAGSFVLGSLGTAAALDVKVNGQWQFQYGYYSHNSLMEASKKEGAQQDRLRFRHRIRTQVRFIADENLSAMLNFEMGDINWGQEDNTGGLDADGYDVKIKHAYLDWTLPGTQIKTRMGVQPIALPNLYGSSVLHADVAGVSVNTQFSPEIGLTAFWARPFDSDYDDDEEAFSDHPGSAEKADDMDLLGFMLPIKTSGFRMTPWVMGAIIGKDSGYWADRGSRYASMNYGGSAKDVDRQGYGYWFGSTFDLPMLDPFIARLEVTAGGLRTGESDMDTFGYFLAGQLGYKFDFGTLSAKGWYSSGDKEDEYGSMPMVSDDNGFMMTAYGSKGGRWRRYDGVVTGNGIGMWGVGLELADVSFVDNLSHTIRATWMRGTNEGGSQVNGKDNKYKKGYMLTTDSAWEINLMNQYKVSENLTLALDFHYVDLKLSKQHSDEDNTHGSFSTQIGVQYAF